MSALQPRDQRRAALSAGLLASNHDGEVVAAARALVGILKKGDLDPTAVVSAGLKSVTTSPIPASRPHWWSVAQFCACHLDQLNDVEQQFVIDMAHRNTRPSEKQEAWLGRMRWSKMAPAVARILIGGRLRARSCFGSWAND